MIRKIKRFFSLDYNLRKVFVQILFLLPAVTLSLKIFGFKRTDWLLAYLFPANSLALKEEQVIAAITSTVQMLRLAARAFSFSTCLPKSLLLWRLLRHAGLICELQFGVKKGSVSNYNAHAWVEYKGVVLNDRSDIRCEYETFDLSIDKKI